MTLSVSFSTVLTRIFVCEGEDEKSCLLFPNFFCVQNDATFRLAETDHVRWEGKILKKSKLNLFKIAFLDIIKKKNLFYEISIF